MTGWRSAMVALCVATFGVAAAACGAADESQQVEALPLVTETAYVDENGNPVDEDGYPLEEAEPIAEPSAEPDPQPAESETSPDVAPDSPEALERAFRTWAENRYAGDTSIAYSLVTESCQNMWPENPYGAPDDQLYPTNPEIYYYEADIDGDNAIVRFKTDSGHLQPSFWHFQNGQWKTSDCEAP